MAAKKRGVKVSDISELVYFLQKDYLQDLTIEFCEINVRKVMEKKGRSRTPS